MKRVRIRKEVEIVTKMINMMQMMEGSRRRRTR
jgi:hypothetical protein